MRFVDDDDLSFCLTISKDIKLDTVLDILGRREKLPELQAFDDFAWETHRPGLNGLLNVFESADGFVVTVENNGFLGVARRTVKSFAALDGLSHYVAIYHSSGSSGYMYCEVQDGTIVANFDPMTDEAPEAVADFFPSVDSDGGGDEVAIRSGMIKAVEYRMETSVLEAWLDTPTATYMIDYRTRGD